MTDDGWSKEERRAVSQAARALSDYLDAWDPIGVYLDGDGPPPGEYDDLVWPLMRLLMDGASEEAIATQVRSLLADQYGMAAPDAEALASRVRTWWDTNSR